MDKIFDYFYVISGNEVSHTPVQELLQKSRKLPGKDDNDGPMFGEANVIIPQSRTSDVEATWSAAPDELEETFDCLIDPAAGDSLFEFSHFDISTDMATQ